MLVVLAVALTAAWGASWAGAAAKRHFMVTYAGTGHYSAKTETQVACGIESRDETTEFSWIANYPLTLSFGRHGFQTVNQTVQPDPAPQSVDNSNSASVSFSGCAGTASCRGRSEPAQGSLAALKVPAAGPGGRSKFRVGGVGSESFRPVDFSGAWNAGDPGSCANWARQGGTLITQEFGITAEILATFPVKYATLKNLPVHHYYKVHIAPGHYAQPKREFCQPNDGCESESFDWSGVVRVKRLS
jgi:hypothetical protein